jgi:cysteinyl-tRNA synthetase
MGFRVTHVMNITDVDDKTIRGALAQGMSLQEYTRTYIEAFFEGVRLLNIIPANRYPRATEHIPEMVAIIRGLIDKGFAYEKNGSYYFSIQRFPGYGRLARIEPEELKPGARVDSDEYDKESPHDFALWKYKKEGEPYWETELGPGRPGWHIECSAMSSRYLGETFDIHCGGVDNIFPHHENEIAQSEAYFGKPFVTTWLHCHHLVVDGEKMAKSKGNFLTLNDLMEKGIEPDVVRWLLLSTHYRKMINFTADAVGQARSSLQRIKDFLFELEARNFPDTQNPAVSGSLQETRRKFIDGLSDDLNISVALTAIFELIRSMNISISRQELGSRDAAGIRELIRSLDTVLGILPPAQEKILSADLQSKIEERERARREKDFRLADAIRDELLGMGILLEDTPEGVRWKFVKHR